jgi:hypothetical protein
MHRYGFQEKCIVGVAWRVRYERVEWVMLGVSTTATQNGELGQDVMGDE